MNNMPSRVALYSVGAERLIQTSALWCIQYVNACVYYNVSSIILYMYVNTWDTHTHTHTTTITHFSYHKLHA